MIEDDDILLCDADYPDHYVHCHHPEDYKFFSTPIDKELTFHRLPDHNRLILRISFRVDDNMFLPVSFICDTGAPSYMYINSVTRRLIKNLIFNDDLGNQFLLIGGFKKMALKSSPAHRLYHPDTNIIGLLALAYFQMYIDGDMFNFGNLPDYL